MGKKGIIRNKTGRGGFGDHPENIIGKDDPNRAGFKNIENRNVYGPAVKDKEITVLSIRRWGEMPYCRLPMKVHPGVKELQDNGFINLFNKKMTVRDVYALTLWVEALKEGDKMLLEILEGKPSVRGALPTEDFTGILPDQDEKKSQMDKYRRRKAGETAREPVVEAPQEEQVVQ